MCLHARAHTHYEHIIYEYHSIFINRTTNRVTTFYLKTIKCHMVFEKIVTEC